MSLITPKNGMVKIHSMNYQVRFFDLTSFYRYTFNYFKGYSKHFLNFLIERQHVERKTFYDINKNSKFGKVLLCK